MTIQQERLDSEWMRDPFQEWIEENMVVMARRPAQPWRIRLAELIEGCLDWMLGRGMDLTDWLRGR